MAIVAVGFSDPQTNAAWASGLGYGYEIWSDDQRVLAEHYQVLTEWDEDPLRHAYVLDEQGQAVLFHAGGVSLGAFPDQVLSDCRELFDD